ncbi:tyrosine-type recombinase/integrase [Streptomyces sp. NPDC052236]|uniref:tyrosine-type recombinase/integrase n=1 Tax=Streptomyces sp. NPDC052236 TaxID=3365686 RepID=UPI0037D2679F
MVEGWDPERLLDEWLAARTYPARTHENYRRDGGRWLASCREQGLAWDKVAAQHIALWAHRPDGPRRATAHRISAVRSLYAYALTRGALPYNPAEQRPQLTNPAQLTASGLDPQQIAALLAALDRWSRADSRHPLRDRACGYLLIGLALRSAQLLDLRLDDLTTDRGRYAVRLPDTRAGERLVPLHPLVRRAVDAYLPTRVAPRDAAGGGLLFTSRTGARLPHRHPHDLLRALARAGGVLRCPAITGESAETGTPTAAGTAVEG